MAFKKVILVLIALILMGGLYSFAEEGISNAGVWEEIRLLKKTISQQAAKITELEKRLVQQEGAPSKKPPVLELMQGLEMGIGATTIVQATHNANGDSQSPDEDVIDASYSLDLTFSKKFQDYGKGFLRLEHGNGAGVDDELKIFNYVNYDADNNNNVRVTEVWYEHYLSMADVSLEITFGKLNSLFYIDDNAYANDETTQFLAGIFNNSPVIEFPATSGGIRFALMPTEFLEFSFIAVDGDADWDDIFDGMFLAGQLNFKPQLLGREGNYRILCWMNDQNHTKWLDTSVDKKKGYGFGLSCDQALTDSLGVFFRYGWQNPKVYLNTSSAFSLEQAYALGAQLKGDLWARKDDIFAFAFGQIMPSDDYKKADVARNAKTESYFECYYNYKLNEHLSISPDLQIIWNPYGKDAAIGDDVIIVGGVRAQVDF